MLDFFMSLDRKAILNCAFAILNQSGYESLTLRRIADGLGVRAPAIYWHFKNKQELLDEMGTQVMREAVAEAPRADPAQSWENWAMAYGIGLRQTLLRYRDGARMFSGTYLTDASLFDAMEASLRKLTGAGFSLQAALCGMGTLYSYTIGFVIEEQAARPMPEEANPQYDLSKRNQRIDRETHPLAYDAGELTFTDYTSRFRAGLLMIVSGMGKALSGSPDATVGQV
jgi:TetR/AcrR family transcriptional regulator, tetracycline repressor protein